MLKTMLHSALLLASLLLAGPAAAADFSVQDISDQEWCWNSLKPWPADSTLPRCSRHAPGTVRVIVTPEPGELPTVCHDNGQGGKYCLYAANLYIAARISDQWFIKGNHTWEPIELSQLPPTTAWPPWAGTASMAYEVFLGGIDLATSQATPPPEGMTVYLGMIPAGSTTFQPSLVTQIYPVPPEKTAFAAAKRKLQP